MNRRGASGELQQLPVPREGWPPSQSALAAPPVLPPGSDLSGNSRPIWLRSILRHRWLILQVTLLGVAAGALLSIWARPLYKSTSAILVERAGGFSTRTWLALLKSRENSAQAAALVKERAGLSIPAQEIRQSLRPRIMRGEGGIEIVALHENPGRAMLIADAVADAFVQGRQTHLRQEMEKAAGYLARDLKEAREEFVEAEKALYKFEMAVSAGGSRWTPETARLTRLAESAAKIYSGALERVQQAKLDVLVQRERLTIGERASFPARPIRPRVGLNILCGGLEGLLLGLAWAFGLKSAKGRIKSAQEAAETVRAPLLAMIRKCKGATAHPLLLARHGSGGPAPSGKLAQMDSEVPAMQDFRTFASNVKMVFRAVDGGAPVLLLVSACRKEGRSSALLNLGAALAQSGKRTTLVEADLRNPALARALGLDQGAGLSDVLSGGCGLEEALWPTPTEGLTLLPAGGRAEDPVNLLDNGRIGKVLQELRQRAEIVLLDSPALDECGDALLIAGHCDGVLLVWEPAIASRQQVQQACQFLATAGVWPSGVVCNKLDTGWRNPAAYRYYYCYLPQTQRA